jgi:ribosomal protein S18 acetylase RimI-like enzyme
VRANNPDINIRTARPQDAPAIAAIHVSNVTRWLRWDAANAPHPARYADLTAYERWQHGGAWMDTGTCRQHLERLLNGGGTPLVAEVNGHAVATAELHPANEPSPYGRNLNLSTLYVHRNHQRQGLGSALLQRSMALAGEQQFETFTVANAEAPDFYKRQGLKQAERWVQYRVAASKSRVSFNVEPLPDAPYAFVSGLGLPVGRYQNAHHDWERTRPNAAPSFDEWHGLRLERHWLTGRAFKAAVVLEELPEVRGVANVFVFTKQAITPQLLSAIRGHAFTWGFSALLCFVRSTLAIEGGVKTGVAQKLFMKRLV